jgi:hypothetical protein
MNEQRPPFGYEHWIALRDNLAGSFHSACICAWCGKTIRTGTQPVTHGMCPTCREQMMAEFYDRR